MGMQVNNARHQGQALGIDLFARASAWLANLTDHALVNGQIGQLWRVTQTIENQGVANEKIVHLELVR